MVAVVFEGHACTDCACIIANADDSGIADPAAHWERIGRTALYALGNVVMACPEDCNGEFRTDACDYCGETDHGDRHPIAVLS